MSRRIVGCLLDADVFKFIVFAITHKSVAAHRHS